jgi:hypothetical protein
MITQTTKIIIHLIERHAECGVAVAPAHRQVVVAAVLKISGVNATTLLDPLYGVGGELGEALAARAVQALGVAATDVQGYGKAALVGTALPLECGAAILHPQLGKAVRACIPGALTIMPSVTKRGGPGCCIDIPMHGVADMWSFDLFDTVSLSLADAPAPDEVLVALALGERGRPHARVRAV